MPRFGSIPPEPQPIQDAAQPCPVFMAKLEHDEHLDLPHVRGRVEDMHISPTDYADALFKTGGLEAVGKSVRAM